MKGKITVVIPCYNEEAGISKVLMDIPYKKMFHFGYETEILVIDNNSRDNTAHVARSLGARVITEKRQGKGYAMRTGFMNVSDDTDIVVMIDGDSSYQAHELFRMVEPISNGFCDVVVGSRLHGKISNNSMSYVNRIGNWLLTFLVRVGYQGNVTDVCSGYFAWKKKVVDELYPHLESKGFAIEMEMIAKMARMGYEIYSVPISYTMREGDSSLHPVKDGVRIFNTWLKHIAWRKPNGKAELRNNEIRKNI
jgi:dolichol-phosphate hexosyltransferase